MTYIGIIITYVFVSNLVLFHNLELSPFTGLSGNPRMSISMGFVMMFIMSLTGLLAWFLQHFILIPLNIVFLQTLVFVLVVLCLVQFMEMIMSRYFSPMYQIPDGHLPLITRHCSMLGIAFISVNAGYGPMESFMAGLSAGLGFLFVLLFMTAIRERLDTEKVPEYLKGSPIALISGGLMALAFMVFDKVLLENIIGG